MLLNLDFSNNTILACVFYFFLIIDLYFLIPEFIAQIFNPIAELVIPSRIPTKEEKAGMETHLVNIKAKIRKCSI